MKKVRKGSYGYLKYEKKKRALLTILMFALPILLYVTAYRVTGTNKNMLTIVAVLGIIPAAKCAVSWIMVMLQKNGDEEAVRVTERTAPDLPHAYELVVTAYEGRLPLDAVVVCGNEVVCCSLNGRKEQFSFMETHITRILNSNRYFQSNVKIFDSLAHYEERLKRIAASPETYRAGISFTPDERYPDLTREEMILHTIMAISL